MPTWTLPPYMYVRSTIACLHKMRSKLILPGKDFCECRDKTRDYLEHLTKKMTEAQSIAATCNDQSNCIYMTPGSQMTLYWHSTPYIWTANKVFDGLNGRVFLSSQPAYYTNRAAIWSQHPHPQRGVTESYKMEKPLDLTCLTDLYITDYRR